MNKISRLALVLACGVSGMTAAANAGVFNYASFPNSNGLTLVNDASVANGRLVLNTATESSRGAAWHTVEKMDVAVGFTTSFAFRITDRQGPIGADGFAFVIQNTSPTAIGADGGAIGYGVNPVYNSQPGIANSLAVEFDVFDNTGGWSEAAGNPAVSIQTRGALENSPESVYSLGSALLPDIGTGATHNVTITYTPGVMLVMLDGNPLLTANVTLDMLSLDAGRAWVGFTASTGGAIAAETHQIESWSFNTVPTPGAGMLAIAGGLLASRRRRA